MVCIIHSAQGDWATDNTCLPAKHYMCAGPEWQDLSDNLQHYAVCVDTEKKQVIYAGKIYRLQET